MFSALRPEGARGLSPGILTPGRASQRRESPYQIKSNVTDRAPGLVPAFDDASLLPSAALRGSHINIQDPGFRSARKDAERSGRKDLQSLDPPEAILPLESGEVSVAAQCLCS